MNINKFSEKRIKHGYRFIKNGINYLFIINDKTYSGVGRPKKTDYKIVEFDKFMAELIGTPPNLKLRVPNLVEELL